MFQGSESLEKLAHFRHVQGSGGVFNGSTHQDYTDYFEILPAAALERGLFLEADRLRAPKLTEENLANQIDVVKEEIRLNVLNRPYGGFPWILLPPVLYSTFANAHNGYGDFTDLERSSLDDAAAFFDAYYAPGNAVLTVVGDFDVADASALVERHFGDIPARAVPAAAVVRRACPRRRTRGVRRRRPRAAARAGAGLPHARPGHATCSGYLAHAVLASLLTDGEAARLTQRLVYGEGLVTDLSASAGLMGAPLDARDPDTFTITAVHPDGVEPRRVVDAVDGELATLAVRGPRAGGTAPRDGPLVVGALPRARPADEPHARARVRRARPRARRAVRRAARPPSPRSRRRPSRPRQRPSGPMPGPCSSSPREPTHERADDVRRPRPGPAPLRRGDRPHPDRPASPAPAGSAAPGPGPGGDRHRPADRSAGHRGAPPRRPDGRVPAADPVLRLRPAPLRGRGGPRLDGALGHLAAHPGLARRRPRGRRRRAGVLGRPRTARRVRARAVRGPADAARRDRRRPHLARPTPPTRSSASASGSPSGSRSPPRSRR